MINWNYKNDKLKFTKIIQLTALKINFLITTNMSNETTPDKSGDINQDETIFNTSSHWITLIPFETIAIPIVAPTILWVPDTGKFKIVANISQIQQPLSALT